MIKCNLSKLMGIHKMSIQDVHEKTGLNRATISNLYHEKVTRIDFETMDKLCKLFNCQAGPGELFEYIEDDKD
jgi:putative transcriptional regulator